MISNKTVKKVYINTTNKAGEPLIDKNKNPYKLIALETTDGIKASMFCGKFGQKDLEVIQTWQEGQAIRISLEQNGVYWNFSLPTKIDELEARVIALEQLALRNSLQGIPTSITPTSTVEEDMVALAFEKGADPNSVDADQIPF